MERPRRLTDRLSPSNQKNLRRRANGERILRCAGRSVDGLDKSVPFAARVGEIGETRCPTAQGVLLMQMLRRLGMVEAARSQRFGDCLAFAGLANSGRCGSARSALARASSLTICLQDRAAE
jgi:hypothetical protein